MCLEFFFYGLVPLDRLNYFFFLMGFGLHDLKTVGLKLGKFVTYV